MIGLRWANDRETFLFDSYTIPGAGWYVSCITESLFRSQTDDLIAKKAYCRAMSDEDHGLVGIGGKETAEQLVLGSLIQRGTDLIQQQDAPRAQQSTAMAIRCACPSLSPMPRSPSSVSMPDGKS